MLKTKSYCRLCQGFCGMDVTLDDHGRVTQVRGDHANPATQGYACIKGLDAPAGMYGPHRILRPRKKVGDTYIEIPLEQALDEIAAKIGTIIDEDGARSMAFMRGTGTFGSTIAVFMFPGLADALGSPRFSTMTIDQSAKWVRDDRFGTWKAGKHAFSQSDVWLFAGANPLVSVYSWHTPVQNPTKKMKEARERGMKIIVVDPRATELTQYADVHLQLYPGEDAAVAAGMIHLVLANGWEDKAFSEQHLRNFDRLRDAVAPFTPDMVAARAGIDVKDLGKAARIFANEAKRGSVTTGTGTSMSRFPNLTEHLYEALGAICGRYNREGDILPNPGVINAKKPPRAEAIDPKRGFEKTPPTRVRGAAQLMGESATPTLAEEILTPGKGRIRGLMISGANPASAIPDSEKVVEAFRALDLLVAIEPFENETTALAHYVLPPRILYEHIDFTFALEMVNLDYPYAQFTEAVAAPPEDSELADEGYISWAIAKRLGKAITFFGTELETDQAPTDEDYLRILSANARVPFDQLRSEAVGGKVYEDLPDVIVRGPGENAGRLDVMPEDVASELEGFLNSAPEAAHVRSGEFPLRLIARRVREVSNTSCRTFPTARKRMPFNPLFLHPDDLHQSGLDADTECWVVSRHGRIPSVVRADKTLKPGTVSMAHGFGWVAGEDTEFRDRGSSVSLLVSLDEDTEALQAMPRMSGIPVRIEAR
ncbi:molybdopterin-containing oxidoreductase family protein [Novosphingobium malaysiense]|uniref:molybdopterin-containing oxidoreductase family protein n=1 Tax=Novosphingobium malaysiense TaxID=1348853 RepID=UPI0022B1754A|nr:molybdopterin-dependent oxidoreductase [Novosphingobium malaysiense]